MKIHDDYYEHYGVEELSINKIYFGVGTGKKTIKMNAMKLKGWKHNVTYHERLKESYYMVKDLWKGSNS